MNEISTHTGLDPNELDEEHLGGDPNAPDSSEFRWYAAGVGAWFIALGAGSVIVTWLVTIVLHSSPQQIGFMQMAQMLPSMLLLLAGGTLADRRDPRSLLIRLHLMFLLPQIVLIWAVMSGNLSYFLLMGVALASGVVSAFVIPARDTMLTQVTSGPIQRSATLVTMLQFGGQMIGIALAGQAETIGAAPFLIFQSVLILVSTLFVYKLAPMPRPPKTDETPSAMADFFEGITAVAKHKTIRFIILMTTSTGIFYMGTFMVGLPILVRDYYGGSSQELAIIQMAFMGGTIFGGMIIMRIGPIHHPGRVMIFSMFSSAFIMAGVAQGPDFYVTTFLIFLWGAGAGMSMPMTRTIVQTTAPAAIRSRMLAVFQMTFMGAAPIGSLIMGIVIDSTDVLMAMYAPPIASILAVAFVLVFTNFWNMPMPTEEEAIG